MNAVSDEQLDDLHAWLEKAAANGAIAVLAHRNGDMDSIGSAVALASSRPQAAACGIYISKLAARVLSQVDAPFMLMSADMPRWPARLGGVVVVDAASSEQTGVSLPSGIPLCVIDHHHTSGWKFGERDLQLNCPVSATTQIVHSYLARHHPKRLTTQVRKLLLAGLITDTGRFHHADEGSFHSASLILSGADIDYSEFVEMLESSNLSRSDKGAVAHALARAKGIDAGAWWLLHTSAGTQEGVVCTALMRAGADVAIVLRSREGICRVTARASRMAILDGLNLGTILEGLSTEHGGEGGGHAGAAGWTSELDVVAAESAFIHCLSGIKRG